MKMNYLLDRKTVFKNREKQKKPFYWFGLGLVIFLIVLFLGANYFNNGSWFLARIWWWGDRNSDQLEEDSAGWFSTKNSLIKTNQELKAQVSQLELEKAKWLDNLTELTELRRVFKRDTVDVLPKAVGRVLAGPTFMGFDILMIDLQQNNQTEIKPGDLVKMDNVLVLGQFIKYSGQNSMVKLYSSSGVEVPVFIGW